MFAVLTGSSYGAVINGGFETGDLTGWTTLGNVSVSSLGDYDVAGIINPDSGDYSALLVTNGADAGTIASTMGISLATLQASGGGEAPTNGSLIYQTVSAVAGDSFQFRWNFVEQDYLPFDDWAFYGISLNGAPANVSLFASLGTVGPEAGTTINGWETLNIDITEAGDYTFYFGIVNARDEALDSNLWLDGIIVGDIPASPIPEPSSVLGLGLLLGTGVLVRKRRN